MVVLKLIIKRIACILLILYESVHFCKALLAIALTFNLSPRLALGFYCAEGIVDAFELGREVGERFIL